MTTKGHVHWEEGLFLRPHHLQLMQRRAFEDLATERRLLQPYPYGVVELAVSRDELSNLIVRFDRLRVIMPSGLYVDIDSNAELPPLDVTKPFKAGSGPLAVHLAVPLWYPTRANAVDGGPDADWRVKRLYRVTEVERPDENSGENPQPIRVRRVNARLLLEGDDLTDLEVLPLLRIVHGAGEEIGVPREDPNFVPPCFLLSGSVILRNLARDLANAVDASRRELLVQMTRGGFSVETMRGIQFEQMLRLRTLNYYGGRLMHLIEATGVGPFEMYLELRGLLGELAALQPDRDQSEVPDYDHDAPFVTFTELARRIRALLRGTVAPSFIKVEFEREGNLFAAALSEEHFTRPTDYYLAINHKEEHTTMARLVADEDRFKLMPKSMAGRAVRGVKLMEERQPPMQLPVDAERQYFRLITADNPRMWERVKQEMTLSAQWPGAEGAEVSLTLYMPVAEYEADS
ncbi:MAG: type VI secretion system baseplate subunit TssK [Phycisphaerales bacterium]|nr:MAG: type VI secretion system baseplate subunit TssK [Phycisphaerales bacterium]